MSFDDPIASCGCYAHSPCTCEPESESAPECSCGEPLTRGTECDVCSWDRAMATIDWRAHRAAIEDAA